MDGATFHSASLPESLPYNFCPLGPWRVDKSGKTPRMSKPKLPFVLLMAVDSLLLDDSVVCFEG